MSHDYDPRFGPAAQTPPQRAYVLARMQEAITSLRRHPSPQARQLYDRYVAGDLSWQQLRQALDSGTTP